MTRAIGSALLLAVAAFIAFVVASTVIHGAALCFLEALRRVLP